MKTKLMVGSKLTNRYGGKGVISKVLPDNQMPVMVDDKGKKSIIDCVMNPYSTINRKIPSVNMESMLGKIAHRIHDIVEEYKNDPTKMDKIMPLMEKYYPGRYSNLTVSQFIKLHNSNKLEDVYYFNVGSYSTKFKPELINEWAKELGVTSQSRILIPSNTVADLKELKENLDPVEYEEAVKGMTGKYVEIDKPLTVGWIMMEELYQIPVYSSKATSSMFGTDVDAWRDSPILGRGAYRTTGQKIGEMELSALLARGASDFIQASRSDTVKTDNQVFLNNLLGLGLTVTDSKGYNQGGSSRKTKIEDMKVKFRRKKLE